MKFAGTTKVMVPWFDTDGFKNWQIMTFRGEIDKRSLLSKVVKYIKDTFGRTVSKTWVLKRCPIINDQDVLASPSHDKAYKDMIEAFIDRVQFKDDVDAPES